MTVVSKTLSIEVLKVNETNQTTMGPILRPEIRDRQKTVIAEKVIKATSYDFAARLNVSKNGTRPGIGHADFSDGKLSIVELWLEKMHLAYGKETLEVVAKNAWADDYLAGLPSSSYLTSCLGTSVAPAYAVKDADGVTDIIRVYDAIKAVRDDLEGDKLPAEVAKVLIREARKMILPVVDAFAAAGKTFCPKGSWMGCVKVLDAQVWSGVQKGLYNGFSIGGDASVVYEG